MVKAICAILLSFSLFSCANRISNRGQGTSGASGYSEDLSVVRPEMDFKAPDEELKETKKEVEKNSFKPAELKNENSRIETALTKISDYNGEQKEASGFRIQVFSGNSRGDYESAKSYILQHFPELEIYESYSQPTYRIKVGDFLKRMDAERYYSTLVDRFTAAKITMERVNIQKGFEIN